MARSRLLALDPLRPGALTLGIGCAVLAFALVGCDSGTQEPDAPKPEAVEYSAPTPAPMDASDGAGAPARPSGEVAEGFEAAIPSNFPSDVPILPDAQAVLGQGGNVDGSERAGVQLTTDKSPQDVVAYYEQELRAGGWEIGESPNELAVTATRGSSVVMLLAAPDASGGSTIYMITEEGAGN
jgi:hypothetical protein